MNNQIQDLFSSLAFEEHFRPALHVEWKDIDCYASELLAGIFGRYIHVEARRSDYYYWSLDLSETPITEDEMERLNDLIQADDYDREIQSYDGFPVTEIVQGLSCKLLSKLTPFHAATSFADDEGVWLIGNMIDEAILKKEAENIPPKGAVEL